MGTLKFDFLDMKQLRPMPSQYCRIIFLLHRLWLQHMAFKTLWGHNYMMGIICLPWLE